MDGVGYCSLLYSYMNDLVGYLWFKILKDWHSSDLVQIDLEQLLKIEKQGIEFSSLDY